MKKKVVIDKTRCPPSNTEPLGLDDVVAFESTKGGIVAKALSAAKQIHRVLENLVLGIAARTSTFRHAVMNERAPTNIRQHCDAALMHSSLKVARCVLVAG